MRAKISDTDMTLEEAVGYLSPHPSSNGTIILTAVVMRKAIGVIRENLNRVATLEIQKARMKEERDAAMEDAWKYRDLADS